MVVGGTLLLAVAANWACWVYVLLNKLPHDIRLLVSRKVSEKDWSLNALLKELREELQAREHVVVDKPPLRNSSGKSVHRESIHCCYPSKVP